MIMIMIIINITIIVEVMMIIMLSGKAWARQVLPEPRQQRTSRCLGREDRVGCVGRVGRLWGEGNPYAIIYVELHWETNH